MDNEQKEDRPFEEVLAEVSDNAAMYKSGAFKRLLLVLEGWESEAQERMLKNHSKDLAWSFQQLWIQRKDLVNGIKAWGENATKQRDDMIEQMKRELLEV